MGEYDRMGSSDVLIRGGQECIAEFTIDIDAIPV